jgi:hypothetical protein
MLSLDENLWVISEMFSDETFQSTGIGICIIPIDEISDEVYEALMPVDEFFYKLGVPMNVIETCILYGAFEGMGLRDVILRLSKRPDVKVVPDIIVPRIEFLFQHALKKGYEFKKEKRILGTFYNTHVNLWKLLNPAFREIHVQEQESNLEGESQPIICEAEAPTQELEDGFTENQMDLLTYEETFSTYKAEERSQDTWERKNDLKRSDIHEDHSWSNIPKDIYTSEFQKRTSNSALFEGEPVKIAPETETLHSKFSGVDQNDRPNLPFKGRCNTGRKLCGKYKV